MTDRADRGVSEVVGFVFVFAIVILSVVLVSVTGYAGLEQSRAAERADNAERGMDLFADDVDDVARDGVPSRTTELRVSEAGVSVVEQTTVTVRINGTQRYVGTLGSFVYEADAGSSIVYENGAVIRADRSGAVFLRDPELLVSENETVLTLVNLTAVETSGIGGSGPVHVRVTGGERELVVAESATRDVTVEITSPNAVVWNRYFEAHTDVSCPDVTTCTWTTERVYVTVVDAEVRFD